MAFDVIIRALFSDSGLSAGLAKANAGLRQLGQSGPGARTGLRAMEGGIRALAFEAAGLQGGVGRLSEGLLKFGGGSALVLGVTAGIGLVAAAYRLATAESRALTESNKQLEQSWQGLIARGKPTVALANELGDAVKKLSDEQERLARLQSIVVRGPTPEEDVTAGTPGQIAAAQANVAQAQRNVDEINRQLGEARDQLSAKRLELIRNLEREADLIGKSTTEVARLRAAWAGMNEEETVRFIAASRRLEQLKEENRVLEAQRNLLEDLAQIEADVSAFFTGAPDFPTFAQEKIAGIKVPTLADLQAQEGNRIAGLQVTELEKQAGDFAFGLDQGFFDRVQADVDAAIAGLDEGGKSAGMIMAQSFVLALPGLMSGGAAGIFAGFGQIATGASALQGAPAFLGPIGFGLGIVGSLISVFDNSAERRHRELMEETRRIRENTERRGQPDRTSVTILLNGKEISGALVEDVLYGIRRMERRNAVPVLPPS